MAEPAHADVAVPRPRPPYEELPGFFGSFFQSGSPVSGEGRPKEILTLLEAVPTPVCVNPERPPYSRRSPRRPATLVADHGARDAALRDVGPSAGRGPTAGCPSNCRVPRRRWRRPARTCPDTEASTFPYGHGLTF
ncbi:hypothetical protein [Streptomyces sp. NBC_01314]|uniref:hypothetical protein n=1 Tax=Streptomyces sp. NBC_01314 TaxID=2903821 RepID=UPI003087EBDA|nr:hypothetical protein OG622_17055 [Streptomyces sp. NBC_01314]